MEHRFGKHLGGSEHGRLTDVLGEDLSGIAVVQDGQRVLVRKPPQVSHIVQELKQDKPFVQLRAADLVDSIDGFRDTVERETRPRTDGHNDKVGGDHRHIHESPH